MVFRIDFGHYYGSVTTILNYQFNEENIGFHFGSHHRKVVYSKEKAQKGASTLLSFRLKKKPNIKFYKTPKSLIEKKTQEKSPQSQRLFEYNQTSN